MMLNMSYLNESLCKPHTVVLHALCNDANGCLKSRSAQVEKQLLAEQWTDLRDELLPRWHFLHAAVAPLLLVILLRHTKDLPGFLTKCYNPIMA